MVDTVVLIKVSVGTAEKVARDLGDIKEVESVLVVTGPYDVIALATIQAREGYRRFVNAIHEIEGVTRTETCLAI